MGDTAQVVLEATIREESGLILSGLIRRVGGDFSLAEEAFQEACAAALVSWPRDGVPRRPGAWLALAASRKALDLLRSAHSRRRAPDADLALQTAAVDPAETHLRDEALDECLDSSVNDDLLRLIFTCCHPALSLDSRVALTLRTVGGLTTSQIASAFLLPESTLAQRLVRAQQRIRNAGIPYRVPRQRDLPERVEGVLSVLYLIFNEGYSSSADAQLLHEELCAEAIRMARLLAQLLPEDGEVAGLLALLLLQHGRRAARFDAEGGLVTLEEQDRSLWDRGMLAQGLLVLERARSLRAQGTYALQALIAAEHALAPTAADTDWARIVSHYDALLDQQPTPVIALNRAAAVAMALGPHQGLEALATVANDGALDGYRWLHLLRGELRVRAGEPARARADFARALELSESTAERARILRRLRELERPPWAE
jgi:RNA polymerase sigma-70 factor (ECF subfamily)